MRELDALLALLPLERLPRTGWILAGVPQPETLAAHTVSTALLALTLGPRVTPPLDVDRVVALTLVHDVPEALLSDLPLAGGRLLPPGAKRTAETRAMETLLAPLSETALERGREYLEASTREARLARLLDKLQLGLRLLAYERAGQRGLEDFHRGLHELDCSEFPPCAEFHRELLEALEARR